jgi:Flp pilus assembly protein TadD
MNSTTSRSERHTRAREPIGVGIPTSAALLPQAYRLLSCGQFEQSAACAARASCIDPTSGFARLRRGLALSKAGRRREALDQLARAVAPAPHDAQIRYKLAVACAGDEILFAATTANRRARSVPSELLHEPLKDIEGVRFYSLMPAKHRAAFAPVRICASSICLFS